MDRLGLGMDRTFEANLKKIKLLSFYCVLY